MSDTAFFVTKSYRDLPAAHRQPMHGGHCRWLHGHNWRFDITFGCVVLDQNGFVIDVGELDEVEEFLIDYFDHTLLLNEDDPRLKEFHQLQKLDLFQVRTLPNCGMEGLARFVFSKVYELLLGGKNTERGVRVVEVTCWEDSKNRATYRP